jgi:hypothetical protein
MCIHVLQQTFQLLKPEQAAAELALNRDLPIQGRAGAAWAIHRWIVAAIEELSRICSPAAAELASLAAFKHAAAGMRARRIARNEPKQFATAAPQWTPTDQPATQGRWSQCLGAVCRPLHKAAAGRAPARVCGAEHRRVRGRVRSTHRELTCRCMFECNDRREWSEFSDGHEPEERRAAEAKRRPPHPRAGACPVAALPRKPLHAGNQPFNTSNGPRADSRFSAQSQNCGDGISSHQYDQVGSV